MQLASLSTGWALTPSTERHRDTKGKGLRPEAAALGRPWAAHPSPMDNVSKADKSWEPPGGRVRWEERTGGLGGPEEGLAPVGVGVATGQASLHLKLPQRQRPGAERSCAQQGPALWGSSAEGQWRHSCHFPVPATVPVIHQGRWPVQPRTLRACPLINWQIFSDRSLVGGAIQTANQPGGQKTGPWEACRVFPSRDHPQRDTASSPPGVPPSQMGEGSSLSSWGKIDLGAHRVWAAACCPGRAGCVSTAMGLPPEQVVLSMK